MPLMQRRIMYDGENFQHYHACQYIPMSKGSDKMSQSILSFKHGQSLHKLAWTECSIEGLKSKPELKGSLVIRALGHDEMKVSGISTKPLDYLCTKVAHAIAGSYSPDCLIKTKAVTKLAALKKNQRVEALYKSYKFMAPDRMPKHIIVVDDIFTSGATICAIIDSVLKTFPSVSITIYTLAVTDHNGLSNIQSSVNSLQYTWEPNEGWMQVEEDSPGYGDALALLKAHINNNFFS